MYEDDIELGKVGSLRIPARLEKVSDGSRQATALERADD
jgi:hypothetical protein